jgi:hypothetical protein
VIEGAEYDGNVLILDDENFEPLMAQHPTKVFFVMFHAPWYVCTYVWMDGCMYVCVDGSMIVQG